MLDAPNCRNADPGYVRQMLLGPAEAVSDLLVPGRGQEASRPADRIVAYLGRCRPTQDFAALVALLDWHVLGPNLQLLLAEIELKILGANQINKTAFPTLRAEGTDGGG